MAETWLKCSACRTDIGFSTKFFQCSVSTCNRARIRLVFCSVACWDSHIASARHRDAWAEDKISPTKAAWERELADLPPEPARSPMPPRPASPAAHTASTTAPDSIPAPQPARPGTLVSTPPMGVRRVVVDQAPAPAPAPSNVQFHDVADRDILIVISKLKKYIKDRSGMNCSDAVAEVLSDHIRALADDSIRAAGRDERKTVLDRDVPRPRR